MIQNCEIVDEYAMIMIVKKVIFSILFIFSSTAWAFGVNCLL